MNLLKFLPFSLVILASSCSVRIKDPVDYVNPYIGNISHLLVPVYPTVHNPNSMLRFYPTRNDFTSNRISGFPLNVVAHRSGKVFNFAPASGDYDLTGLKAGYTYDNERISPYSYSVTLDEHDVGLTFIPASKSGFFSLAFNSPGERNLLISTTGSGQLIYDNGSITGYDTFNDLKTYLFLEFEKAPLKVETSTTDVFTGSASPHSGRMTLTASFGQEGSDPVKLRYGLSYISPEQAERNLKNDITGWNTRKIAGESREKWNDVLSRIEVEGGTHDQRVVFYTSLYRCFERMIDITEENRYFSVWSGKVEEAGDTAFYTDDWVWDTYLALHPLQLLLNPADQDEKIASYIRMARQSGWMPTFPTPTGDNHAMNGNHSAAVILDAWKKGIKGFDLAEAYRHLKNTILYETKLPWVKDSATWLDNFYDTRGYFPALKKGEPETFGKVHSFERRQAVAITLASCYDDWCMAQIARELGLNDDYNFFSRRSLNYRNLFREDTGFYHPKDSSGNWIEPFDYIFDGGMGARDYYDENNGWTYIWQPYHAFRDLIAMMGGMEKFDNKLDQLFTQGLGKSKWQYYSTLPDATGNVGQFVMGNEPSMHIPYLYNYAGKPWKTQKRVRMLMDTWFRNDLMGIPGDEDGGGLSAFYVFSAMGFYPVTPGIPEYQLGSPLFSKIRIRLDNGEYFTIKAGNNSPEKKYIRSASLNGHLLANPSITHQDIISGGTLVLEMDKKPVYSWGNTKE